MYTMSNLSKYVVAAVMIGGVAILTSQWIGPRSAAALTDLEIPKFSKTGAIGEKAFAANCATCHGVNAVGTDKGPPLVHKIYNPGHHADGAFYLAARNGTRQHHWRFGNMPAQPQVSDDDLQAIVKYVRELQQANGIFYQPHKM